MLKRIKVRAKLLLLLVIPLTAVVAFAAQSAQDLLDSADRAEGEAQIAEFARATSDLGLALDLQEISSVREGALGRGIASFRPSEQSTDDVVAAVSTWKATTAATSAVVSPTTQEGINAIDAQLDSLLVDLGQMGDVPLSPVEMRSEYESLGFELSVVIDALASETSDVDTLRALTIQSDIADARSSLVDIGRIGAVVFNAGEFTRVRQGEVEFAERRFELAYTAIADATDPTRLAAADADESSAASLATEEQSASDEIASLLDQAGMIEVAVSWVELNETRLLEIQELGTILLNGAQSQAKAEVLAANQEASGFITVGIAVVLGVVLLAFLVARSIARPLRRLTGNARRLADEDLPALVDSLRSGEQSETEPLVFDTRGRDEVAQLSRALADIQTVTVDVAEEQGDLLQRGISEMFVNLARRNQSLLDRQIDFIDQLESSEENPDVLENLFRLDHLATRMRRNAESLLVLAGAEPTRRRGQPVEMADVVRVAMGEIEDFNRVQLLAVDRAAVSGSVAIDIAHLLSELMENASQFSPPDTPVEVVGQRIKDDSYQLTVTDHGIGMAEEQVSEANALLAKPPAVGLDLSRSLGFTVASRLASRLGLQVRLTHSKHGGIAAVVEIPQAMLVALQVPENPDNADRPPEFGVARGDDTDADEPTVTTGPRTGLGDAEPVAPAPTDAAWPPDWTPIEGAPSQWMPEEIESGDSAPLPHRQAHEPTVAIDIVPEPGTVEDLFEAIEPGAAVAPEPPQPGADLLASLQALPASHDSTALPTRGPGAHDESFAAHSDHGSPLPTRQPQSNTEPPSSLDAPPPPPSGLPSEPPAPEVPAMVIPPANIGSVDPLVTSAGLIRRTPRNVEPVEDESSPATKSARSPEEVRQMLSRYRAGLRKGREPGEA